MVDESLESRINIRINIVRVQANVQTRGVIIYVDAESSQFLLECVQRDT
jgi:hypothetical protein